MNELFVKRALTWVLASDRMHHIRQRLGREADAHIDFFGDAESDVKNIAKITAQALSDKVFSQTDSEILMKVLKSVHPAYRDEEDVNLWENMGSRFFIIFNFILKRLPKDLGSKMTRVTTDLLCKDKIHHILSQSLYLDMVSEVKRHGGNGLDEIKLRLRAKAGTQYLSQLSFDLLNRRMLHKHDESMVINRLLDIASSNFLVHIGGDVEQYSELIEGLVLQADVKDHLADVRLGNFMWIAHFMLVCAVSGSVDLSAEYIEYHFETPLLRDRFSRLQDRNLPDRILHVISCQSRDDIRVLASLVLQSLEEGLVSPEQRQGLVNLLGDIGTKFESILDYSISLIPPARRNHLDIERMSTDILNRRKIGQVIAENLMNQFALGLGRGRSIALWLRALAATTPLAQVFYNMISHRLLSFDDEALVLERWFDLMRHNCKFKLYSALGIIERSDLYNPGQVARFSLVIEKLMPSIPAKYRNADLGFLRDIIF